MKFMADAAKKENVKRKKSFSEKYKSFIANIRGRFAAPRWRAGEANDARTRASFSYVPSQPFHPSKMFFPIISWATNFFHI